MRCQHYVVCGIGFPREGYDTSVEFTEKLRALVEASGRSRLSIARDAGLSEAAVSNYINAGHTPRADTALKLARALRVPVEWLIDDAQDWPPPQSPDELRRLLGHHLRSDGIALAELFAIAESVDWIAVARSLLRLDPLRDRLPDELQREATLPFRVSETARKVSEFSPYAQLDPSDSEVARKVLFKGRLDLLYLLDLPRELRVHHGYDLTSNIVLSLWPDALGLRERQLDPVQAAKLRSQFADELTRDTAERAAHRRAVKALGKWAIESTKRRPL